MKSKILAAFAIVAATAGGVEAQESPAPLDAFPSDWLQGLRAEARGKGVGDRTLDKVFATLKPVKRVVELDRSQPEFTQTFWGYLGKRVNKARIERGRKMLKKHAALLERVKRRYGVPPRFLVAFWGLESNFGDYTGVFPVADAVVTLAYDPRRAKFFRQQFIAALQLIERGDFGVEAKASWAGAMGQTQFIPTTYRDFAVDFDGDSKRDLWKSLPDVFGSSANYLSRAGWRPEETWGREVSLPNGFDLEQTGMDTKKTIAEWAKLGVRKGDGGPLPMADMKGSIILPGGWKGPAFLVYKNFRVIMVWNRSALYAVSVGYLADLLVTDARRIQKPRPAKDEPLARSDVEEIQRLLVKLGYDAGKPDGIVGSKTRKAIKRFQKESLLPADGYPSIGLLERLKGGR